MNAEPDVVEVLRAVAAGTPIDWSAIESSATDDSFRSVIRELKVIAEIAELHRSLPDTGGSRAERAEQNSTPQDGAATAAAAVETWGPLTLLERVGHGSFGDVYRAWDSRLDREVALKLLRRDETTRDDLASTVIDEGRMLARVRHPNVVTVHGADRVDGRVGLWMEFIHGRTFEQVVREHGPLGAREAALVGLDVCRGLSAVHRAGLIHRDIKAQNLMREEGGRVVLMDFGAGRPIDGGGGDLAGTPLYVAPEILEGAPATLQSDLYSVGVLLYHLVTRSYPVEGATIRDVFDAHRHKRRTLLRDIRPDLPEKFIHVVERALAIDPAERFQSAGALEGALSRAMDLDAQRPDTDTAKTVETELPASPARRVPRRVWLSAAAALLLAGAAAWNWATASKPPLAFQARDWILLVPFENRSGDAALDGAIEAALEHELVNSRFVNVVPRARVDDALRLMKKPLETRLDPAIGREVCLRDGGIRAFVTGRVEKIGAMYVLTASLADAGDGRAVASVTEEASFGELPVAVRRLSNKVRETLGEARTLIQQTNERLEKVTTPSLRALRLYTESYQLGDRGQWPAALVLARQAVAEDPEFAAGQIWLAWALHRTNRPPEEYRPVAARAMRLADRTTDWERYWIVGSYHTLHEEYEQAAAPYEVLLGLYPDHRWAMNNLMLSYNALRRTRDAAPLAVRLADSQPNNPRLNAAAVVALTSIKDFDRARPYVERVRQLMSGVDIDPPLAGAVLPVWLFPAYEALYKRDVQTTLAALQTIGQSLNQMPAALRETIVRGPHLPLYYLALGQTDRARRVILLIPDADDRHLYLGLLAFLRGDARSTRDELRQVRVETTPGSRGTQQWWLPAWLLVRIGMFAEARAIIDAHAAREALFANALRGELALGGGNVTQAVALLRQFLADPHAGVSGPAYRAVESLADALVRQGALDEAVNALETGLAWREIEAANFLPAAAFSMRLQLKLAELHHRLEHDDRARPLVDDLARLLAAADPDFPLLLQVRRLQQELSRRH